MVEICEVPLTVRLWYPRLTSGPNWDPSKSEEVYIPRPSFSATERDKSTFAATFSCDENFRSNGFILALLFVPDLDSEVTYGSACALAGILGLAVLRRKSGTKVGEVGLWVEEAAELPRLCNLACETLAAANAPWLGEDLIFGSFGPWTIFEVVAGRELFHDDPGPACAGDNLDAPSVCDLHTRPPANDVCDDMLPPRCWYGSESSKGLAMTGRG